MTDDYSDIIELPHHISSNRPQMPMSDRAMQFAPFAALEGHGAAIQETARLTHNRRILYSDELEILNEKLNILNSIEFSIPATIEYYIEDESKFGGKYIQICDKICRVDNVYRYISTESGIEIPIDDIVDIQSEVFKKYT